MGICCHAIRRSVHVCLFTVFVQSVEVMEFLHIAPKGTSETHRMLSAAADSLAEGGVTGIFTPMFFFIAYKPEH